MNLFSEITKRVWAVPCFFMAAAFVYLLHHGMTGERGILAIRDTQKEIEQLQEVLGGVKAKREQLQRRTEGLYSEHIDPDLLDETARKVLGVTREDEYVIFLE